MLAACAVQPERLQWQPVAYEQIPGWAHDRHAEALAAFRRSCASPKPTDSAIATLMDPGVLAATCREAAQWRSPSHNRARRFFERHFTPYRLHTNTRHSGLFTGYYIPVLNGSLTPDARFAYPAYAVPADLRAPAPYATRAQIEAGALAGRGEELVWLEDPVMLFFLHIQGSGRVRLPDGRLLELRYAGKNHRPYVAIGNVLVERGAIPREKLSLQTIRRWLYEHPRQARDVMQANPSYIFFALNRVQSMPPGAQGVALTPERSLAIDPKQLPYGLPVFVNTFTSPNPDQLQYFRRLMITQDTGGAIRGPLRGDIFFGQGEAAEARAGRQKYRGEWIILIPKDHHDETAQATR